MTESPLEPQPKMSIEFWSGYADVALELLYEIKDVSTSIAKVEKISFVHYIIELSSDALLLEIRLWGGSAIGCGLVTQFKTSYLEE